MPLPADVKVRGQWYEIRRQTAKIRELPSYAEASQDSTELRVGIRTRVNHEGEDVNDRERSTGCGIQLVAVPEGREPQWPNGYRPDLCRLFGQEERRCAAVRSVDP